MELLNIAAALEMLGGEEELLQELIKAFIDTEPFDFDKLLSLEEKEDKSEAAKYVHYYKGAARQIGAEILASTGQKLEDILRGKTNGYMDAVNKVFKNDFEKTIAALKEYAAEKSQD